MLLQDIFTMLTYGELKQFSVGGFEKGGVQAADYPELITHVNLGMTSLYAKFPINEKEVVIQQFDEVTTYELNSKYSVNSSDPDILTKYIVDTVEEPFLNDVMRIDSVHDEAGNVIVLNDPKNINSYFTPTYNSLQIPEPVSTNATFVVYRAAHVPIPINILDPSTVEVNLPSVLVEAMLSYVVSRVFASKTGADAINSSLAAMAKYESICNMVEHKNLLRDSSGETNDRLDVNGWA